MRRLVFVALAVLAVAGTWWLRKQSVTSSFGAYRDAQLRTLEDGYRAAMHLDPGPSSSVVARREAALDAELSLALLEAEQRRRLALRGVALVALLAAVGALLPGRRRRQEHGEEARLREAIGDPAVLFEGERHKAARLLGVALEAPPAVVDAALAAQLAARDLGRLDGLTPDLRQLALEQREALRRARDLLVRGVADRQSGAAPQQ
jgi:hypothetical protein